MNDFDPLTMAANALGLDPLFVAGMVPFIILAGNLIGRAIPDDATGVPGVIRKVAKVVGLYLSNRVSTGISTNSVIKVAAGIKPLEDVPALAEKISDPVGHVTAALEPMVEGIEKTVGPLFPGVSRGPDGKFISTKAQAAEPESE